MSVSNAHALLSEERIFLTREFESGKQFGKRMGNRGNPERMQQQNISRQTVWMVGLKEKLSGTERGALITLKLMTVRETERKFTEG